MARGPALSSDYPVGATSARTAMPQRQTLPSTEGSDASPCSLLRPVRLRHYLAVMRERGWGIDPLLQGTGLDVGSLQGPDHWVLPEQLHAVIRNIVMLEPEAPLGLEMGLRTDLSALGVLAGALLSCVDAEQTLEIWRRFSEPVVGMPSRLSITVSEDELQIGVVGPDTDAAVQRFCIEEVLGLILKLGEVETGAAPQLRALSLSYPKPPCHAVYADLLTCPIQFSARITQIRVARAWAKRSVISFDHEHSQLCLQRCAQLLERLQADAPAATISPRVYQLVYGNLRAVPTLDSVARSLCFSPRTLKRRLQAEGRSYQAIVRQCRIDRACDALGMNGMSTRAVAELLGFGDERSFRRAFKTWTGKPPSAYRAV